MSHAMPNDLKSYLVDILEELSPQSVVWKSGDREFGREDLIEEIKKSSSVAHDFCADILRASRDIIRQRVADNLKPGSSYVAVPEDPSFEWMKSLKMFVWDKQSRELEVRPFLEPEDIEIWETEGGAPSFADMMVWIERNGDRVLEIRASDDSLVYSGRAAFYDEQKARLAELAVSTPGR